MLFLMLSITYPLKNMNRKFLILLTFMIIMDILDDDFRTLSILDTIKVILYIICFISLRHHRKDEK